MPWRSPDRHGITPQNRGRYDGYDVLDQVETWDQLTAGVVLARLAPFTDLSFFTMDENAIAGALCDLLLNQDSEPKIPVVGLIDQRLALGETDGWHYADLPEDGAAWRLTLAHLDNDSKHAYGDGFATASQREQAAVLQAVQDLANDGKRWHEIPAEQVWSLWTRYACTAFYSHPWSWTEIGFGGPAYPRGYKNAHVDGRERWEVADHQDVDPVPFAQRVKRARQTHAGLVGPETQS